MLIVTVQYYDTIVCWNRWCEYMIVSIGVQRKPGMLVTLRFCFLGEVYLGTPIGGFRLVYFVLLYLMDHQLVALDSDSMYFCRGFYAFLV